MAVDADVVRLRRGDLNALAELITRYQNRLYRYLLRIVRQPAEAEDLFQQTWLRVVEKIRSFDASWQVNAWVKKGILLGFRIGAMVDMSIGDMTFRRQGDLSRAALPPGGAGAGGAGRIDGAAGRTSLRPWGCMPPMYINVGAYVDDGTMVDSHALVGSCAQVGSACHLSAAAQIGGVLEPVNASPVIIEDDVLVGGNCGVYEGTVAKPGRCWGRRS